MSKAYAEASILDLTDNSIQNVTNYYAVSSSNSTAPADSKFTVTIPTDWNSTNKYLWNYEMVEYTYNTATLTDKRIIAIYTVDGNDAYTVILTNESHTFAGSTSAAIAGSTTCGVIAYKGSTQVVATVGSITCPTGMSTSISNNGTTSVTITISVTTSMTTKSGTLSIPVTVDGKTFTKQFSYSLALTGSSGSNGTSPTAYSMMLSAAAIKKSTSNTFTPTSVTVSGYSQTGSAARASYSGRFKIEGSSNGTSWTSLYTSSSNESSKSYTISSATYTQYRFSMYVAGGTSTLLDQQIVPVVSDGTEGKGISSITEYYLATSASSGVTTSTSGWSTSISDATIDSTKKYLWNYEVIAYTDSSTSYTSTPIIIGTYGDTGSKGDTGVGISTVTPLYFCKGTNTAPSAPTSEITTTTQTYGAWTKGVPALTNTYAYMFTCEQIKYTDGTFKWSDVVLNSYLTDLNDRVSTVETKVTDEEIINTVSQTITDRVTTAVNNIEIGGRNLIKDTHDEIQEYEYPTSGSSDHLATTTTVELTETQYTLSFWASSTNEGDKVTVYLYSPNNVTSFYTNSGVTGKSGDGCCDFTLTTTLTKYWVVYTINPTNSITHIILPRLRYGNGSGTISVKWEKLESGNKATDWTIAPEDTVDDINQIRSDYVTRDNFTSQIEQTKSDITSTVEENYVRTDDFDTYKENTESSIKQTNDSWTAQFTSQQSIINNTTGAISELQQKTSTIELNNDGLKLSSSDSNYQALLTNTDLQFKDGETIVASIGNQEMQIKQIVMNDYSNTNVIGHFIIVPRSNGNLSFVLRKV